jgi:hypothetical protein
LRWVQARARRVLWDVKPVLAGYACVMLTLVIIWVDITTVGELFFCPIKALAQERIFVAGIFIQVFNPHPNIPSRHKLLEVGRVLFGQRCRHQLARLLLLNLWNVRLAAVRD